MNSKILIAIVIIVIAAAAGYFYLNSQNTPDAAVETQENTETIVEEESTDDMMMEEDAMMEVRTIDMTGEDFSFDPSEISVQVGETVKVVLNAVDMPHDFVVDELDVRSDVANPGETVEVEFTPTEAGEFEYYCSVGNHREMGMVGTLTVTE